MLGNSAVISLCTGSGVGEQDGGRIGAEEKVINSKNKVDENMVSPFSLPARPALILRVIRVGGMVLDALQINRPMVEDGRAPAAPTGLLYWVASGYEME